MIRPVAAVVERHDDETHPVSFAAGHERAAGLVRIAGLETGAALKRREQLVVVAQHPLAHRRRSGRGDARKGRLAHGIRREPRHVERAGIVSLRVQSARVRERGVRHAERRGLLIHSRDEALYPAAAMVGDALRRVVSRRQQQPVEQLLERQHLAGAQVHGRSFLQVVLLYSHLV